MPKKRTSYFDIFAVTLVVLILGGGAFFLITPVRAALLVAVGRGTGCPIGKALSMEAAAGDHEARMRRITPSIKRIEEDREAGLQLLESPQGRFWLSRGEAELLAHLLAEQEEKIYGTGERGVKPGDIVFDCGAHVGVFTKAAIDAGAKLVVAIEPSPVNLECLRRNLAPEIAAGRVVVIPEGVWDKDGTLPFHIDPRNSASNSLLPDKVKDGTTINVPLTTIDKLVARLKLDRVDFVKMDIEGAESHALRGARSTLGQFKPRMAICAYHTPTDPSEILELTAELQPGYRSESEICNDLGFRIQPQTILFH